MAAVIVVACPKCNKQLKAPADLQGKKIRCKDCGTTFPVQAKSEDKPEEKKLETFSFAAEEEKPPEKKAAPAPKKPEKKKPAPVDDDDEEGSSPYGVTDEQLAARCPNCAKEMESEEAVICLHCGYNTRTRVRASIKRVHEITSQDRVHWLMPAIVCCVGIAILVGLNIFFWFGMSGMWNSMDEATTPSLSRGLRTWFSAFSAWIGWIAGKFAFSRLVLQPTPPEEEIKS